MEIHWPYLCTALVLLFTPSTVFYSGAARERLSLLQDQRFPLENMLVSWQNWLDFTRAAGGAYLLTHLAALPGEGIGQGRLLYFAVIGVALTLVIVVQTAHHHKGLYFTAPVFFLWGIMAVLVAPIAVAFAAVFSSVLARMLDHVELKFPIMAVLVVTTGYLMGEIDFYLLLAGVLAALPLVLSYAADGMLVCYNRALVTE